MSKKNVVVLVRTATKVKTAGVYTMPLETFTKLTEKEMKKVLTDKRVINLTDEQFNLTKEVKQCDNSKPIVQ